MITRSGERDMRVEGGGRGRELEPRGRLVNGLTFEFSLERRFWWR